MKVSTYLELLDDVSISGVRVLRPTLIYLEILASSFRLNLSSSVIGALKQLANTHTGTS